MKIRIFFTNLTHQDMNIQTYFKKGEGHYLIVKRNGKEVELHNVDAMVKRK